MHAALVCAAVWLTPTPLDTLGADADLAAPVGTPGVLEPSARSRVALLAAMLRCGAVDPGVEGQWFTPSLVWSSELDFARRMVAQVATCPPLADDTLPSGAWFAWRAVGLRAEAATWRERATAYRARMEWEDDRADRLGQHAREFDGEADRLSAEACRCEWSAGNSWSRPRRVVLAGAGK